MIRFASSPSGEARSRNNVLSIVGVATTDGRPKGDMAHGACSLLARRLSESNMFGRLLFGLTAIAASASAQVPGAPVLQNAFANPGLAIAANFGGGAGQSFYGAAAALGLGAGKLQLSGAAGAAHANGATRGAYGARLSASVWSNSSGGIAVAAFGGLGGAPRTRTGDVVTSPAVLSIPAGVSLGYRHALGSTRGMSAYVSPFYRWMRTDSGTVVSKNSMRVSLGLDFAFSQSFGATFGAELGQNNGGSGAGTVGAAISFVPGRR